jgi:radical SAM superfamily enzyme YgiQ (UPF0313 family)
MKESGCTFVAYGVESADDEVLKTIKKGIVISQAENAIRITKEVGIQTGAFFIAGLPADTANKFKKSLNFAKEANLKEYWFYNAIPYPGTELYRWVDKNAKWITYDRNYLQEAHYFNSRPVYETKEFQKKERIRVLKDAQGKVMKCIFRNEFGLLLGYIAYLIWQIPFLNNMATRIASRIWKIMRKRRLEIALR